MVFEVVPSAVFASAALIAAVFLVLVKVVPQGVLIGWTVVMLLLTALRAVVVWRYARLPTEAHDQAADERYALWYFVPFVLSGLGWGLLPAGIVPIDETLFTVLAMGAVYGLAGGGAAFVGHMRGPYGAFLLATMGPAAFKWLSDWWELGGTYRLVVGMTTLVFIGLLYSAARQLNRLVAGAIEVRLEKEALARRLQELVGTVERANQAKSEFLARIGAELQTPLRAISGQSAALLGATLAPPQREAALQVQDIVDGLLAMLTDVHDYSQIEAGQLQIERVEFDLAELVTRAAAAGRLHAQAKGLAFSAEIAPGLPGWVLGDPRRLTQILANLLSNAVKFTASGSVSLEVKSVGVEGERHTLAFAVRDTGIGIPAHELSGVFHAYSHGEALGLRQPGRPPGSGLTGGRPASGLGLAICRRLAGLMHGALAVESTPGRGSVFTLVLALQGAPR